MAFLSWLVFKSGLRHLLKSSESASTIGATGAAGATPVLLLFPYSYLLLLAGAGEPAAKVYFYPNLGLTH